MADQTPTSKALLDAVNSLEAAFVHRPYDEVLRTLDAISDDGGALQALAEALEAAQERVSANSDMDDMDDPGYELHTDLGYLAEEIDDRRKDVEERAKRAVAERG
ncbi:hypothetical protein AB0A05_27185 [Streptomyces sp. NPDC046374]|uniref:hypothetical protein n=1 Tax=Streptomyces sp. NPDC046374 TaxID=3154917 RepID=UPI0033D58F86